MSVLDVLRSVEIIIFSKRRWSFLNAAIVMLIYFYADKYAVIRGKHRLSIEASGCVRGDIKDELCVPFICRSAGIAFINLPQDDISFYFNLSIALEFRKTLVLSW